MINRPKRRRYKDNPYFLNVDDDNIKYVSFKDSSNILRKVKIKDNIFDVFNQFELDDLSEMNEFDNHIEHSEILEHNLYFKASAKPESIEMTALNNIFFQQVMIEINKLPLIQRRRLLKYYIYDMTLDEIARLENCTQMAIKFSIDIALTKLRKKFNVKIKNKNTL